MSLSIHSCSCILYGITGVHIPTHTWRHTYATRLPYSSQMVHYATVQVDTCPSWLWNRNIWYHHWQSKHTVYILDWLKWQVHWTDLLSPYINLISMYEKGMHSVFQRCMMCGNSRSQHKMPYIITSQLCISFLQQWGNLLVLLRHHLGKFFCFYTFVYIWS